MKRKAPTVVDRREHIGRRQPQTSCINCRVKKLKCDRGEPCASCVVRGLSCTGRSGPEPAAVPQYNVAAAGSDLSILSRLANLERAVFGDARQSPTSRVASTKGPMQCSPAASAVDTPSPSQEDAERRRAAKFLDLTYTREDHSVNSQIRRPRFHVAPTASHLSQPARRDGTSMEDVSRSALIMTREEALLFLHDFFENPYHLLPILYEPSVRSLVNTFYSQLEQGQEADPTVAALILSIASTSASFFNNDTTARYIFASTDEATQVSIAWRETALTILDDPRFPCNRSIEECQARTILAYVVSNVEGCSAQYRLLHSCSVAIARDIALHLVDSAATAETSDDGPTREMKRRLWWHLASTDWLLSFVGGPLDGTYAVQPRHFIVNRPRNLNHNDLIQKDETFTYPLNVLTQMSYFIQRIRLAEVCREIVDAREPGLLDLEITHFDKVASLDVLFERVLEEMPPILQKDAPIPNDAPLHLDQQRDLIHLCIHVRRARLHRPFLLHDTDNPRHEPSRRQCISSARTVLSSSTRMLDGPEGPADRDQAVANALAYRTGLVISNMFMACAILALNGGLIWDRTAGDARSRFASSEIRDEIARACRVLAKAGHKSTFAANLLGKLAGVLKQYNVKEIDDLVAPPITSNLVTEDGVSSSRDNIFHTDAAATLSQPATDSIDVPDDFTMWNEFFTTMPEMEGYDQLFAGLDYYCGPT
ncbi:hypothetical protein F4802DRAFT_576647 [Xylaria palmicola]|nr:hypothetical protein F4802DRAFT_576647 [Xylaria palmicola]